MSTDLPAAIGAALDMPLPASEADHWLYDQILHGRVTAVRGAIDAILSGTPAEAAAETLRRRIAQLPITYRPYESPDAPDAPRGRVARGLGIDLHLPASPGGES